MQTPHQVFEVKEMGILTCLTANNCSFFGSFFWIVILDFTHENVNITRSSLYTVNS